MILYYDYETTNYVDNNLMFSLREIFITDKIRSFIINIRIIELVIMIIINTLLKVL